MATKKDKYQIDLDIVGLNKLKEYQKDLRLTNKTLSALNKKVKGQKAANAAQASQIAKLTLLQKKQKRAVDSHIKSLDKSTSAKRRNAKAGKDSAASMLKMGASVGVAIQAFRKLSQFLITGVKDFAAFEKGVKNVSTLLNGDEGSLLQPKLYQGALDMGRKFGFGLADINKAMFNAVSAGIKGGEAIEFLGEASTLAMAGVTDLKSATLGITTALNAYGESSDKAREVAEILFTTQKYGVTTVEELSKSLGVVLPLAASSGVSLEELGATLSVTTRTGLDAAKSVTAIRAALAQMQKPSAQARDLFIKLGIPMGSAQLKAVGFTETMKRLNKAFKDNPADIEAMFGNIRGLTAVFSVAGDNADQYHDILGKLNDETLRNANLTRAENELMDSMDTKLNRLNSSWKNFSINVGQNDVFGDLVEGTTAFLDTMNDTDFEKFANMISGRGGVSTKDVQKIVVKTLVSDKNLDSIRDEFESGEDLSESTINTIDIITKELQRKIKENVGSMNMTDAVQANKSFNAFLTEYEDYVIKKNQLTAQELADIAAKDAADKLKANNRIAYNKDELNQRLALQKELQDLDAQGFEDGEYANVIELEKLETKLDSFRKLEQKYYLNNINDATELARIKDEIAKAELDIKKKRLQVERTNSKEYDDMQIQLATEVADTKIFEAKKEAKENNLTNAEFRRDMLKIDIAYFDELINAEERKSDETLAKLKAKKANAEGQLSKLNEQTEKSKRDQKVKFAIEGINLIADAARKAAEVELANQQRILDKKTEANDKANQDGLINDRVAKKRKDAIEKESFKLRKENELKLAKISLAQELANIAVQAAANPGNAFTFGAAGGAQYSIMAAIALGRYAANVDSIKSQKFANGGMVHGNSHSRGGEKFAVGGRVVELEGGEAVINKRSTAMFGGALSAMNQAGGGVGFSSPNFGNSGFIDYDAIGAAVGRNTNVVLPVEALRETENRLKVIESSSRF